MALYAAVVVSQDLGACAAGERLSFSCRGASGLSFCLENSDCSRVRGLALREVVVSALSGRLEWERSFCDLDFLSLRLSCTTPNFCGCVSALSDGAWRLGSVEVWYRDSLRRVIVSLRGWSLECGS